jgi:hypothetical protein
MQLEKSDHSPGSQDSKENADKIGLAFEIRIQICRQKLDHSQPSATQETFGSGASSIELLQKIWSALFRFLSVLP